MKKVVGVIPIKLTNRRLPGKNLMDLNGKPLCQYLFDTVLKVKTLDEIYVICSDETICRYIPSGISFLKRPAELDQDTVKSRQILDWFSGQIYADVYALMHVTQPFLKSQTIETAVRNVISSEYDSAFVANEIKEFAWFQGKPLNYSFDNVVQTQELTPVYIEGELFIFERDVLIRYGRRIGYKPYIHPVEWEESVCIDTQEDFDMAMMVARIKERDNDKV